MKSMGFTKFDRLDENTNSIWDDINDEIDTLKKQLKKIDEEQNEENAKRIKKQMIECILETL